MSNCMPPPHKLQVYIGKDEHEALKQYIADHFSEKDRVVSAIVRKALAMFLREHGYLKEPGQEREDKDNAQDP